MIERYTVQPNLPPPARTALHVVQTALKVNRSVAQQLIHDGAVRCGKRLLTQSHWKLNVGDVVEIDYVPQPNQSPRKKSKSPSRFEVIYEDDAVVVVNKPAGMLTVPSPAGDRNSLQSQLSKWVRQRQPGQQAICVHRLDRGVSGILVFAKSTDVSELLREQFADRKPTRRYAAIVQGCPSTDQGSWRSYLTTEPQSLSRYSVKSRSQGELAITHYQVRQRWNDTTLLQLSLETGRRHQIRVHLAEAGHPVVGDQRYMPRIAEHVHWPHRRLALHAEHLSFQHPLSGEQLEFSTSWPQEFRDFRRVVHRPKR